MGIDKNEVIDKTKVIDKIFGYFIFFHDIYLKNKSYEQIKAENIEDDGALEYFTDLETKPLYKFLMNITKEELNDIANYVGLLGSNFYQINSYLRYGGDLSLDCLRQIKSLDNILKKFTAPEDLIVYRGVKLNAFDKFNVTKIEDITSLTHYHDEGFMSASMFKDDSYVREKDYPILFEIKVPKGYEMAYFGFAQTAKDPDYEVLLKRGTTLDITGFDVENINGNDKLVIKCNAKDMTLEKARTM